MNVDLTGEVSILLTPRYYIYFNDQTKLCVKAPTIENALEQGRKWAKEYNPKRRIVSIQEVY